MYEEDAKDVSILKTLLPLMSRHAAGYHPISYTVWYEYARGERPSLQAAVDAELKMQGRLTPSLTYGIYSKHLVEPAEQALVSARADLVKMMSKVQEAVQSTGTDTTHFNKELKQFQRDIAAATTVQDLSAQVTAITAEAQRVGSSFDRFADELSRSQDEVKRLTDELDRIRQDALSDALSGLLNRRGFDREVERVIGRGEPESSYSVIMFDIDHFKRINDNYGHPLGDAVIASVGRLIRDCVGKIGIAARYGGEEFVVALPSQPLDQAHQVAEAIRTRVEQGKIRRRQTDEAIGGITISAGVATWHVKSGDSLEAMIERADKALYRSKEGGRNRVSLEAGSTAR